jgi:hypothetical protein
MSKDLKRSPDTNSDSPTNKSKTSLQRPNPATKALLLDWLKKGKEKRQQQLQQTKPASDKVM